MNSIYPTFYFHINYLRDIVQSASVVVVLIKIATCCREQNDGSFYKYWKEDRVSYTCYMSCTFTFKKLINFLCHSFFMLHRNILALHWEKFFFLISKPYVANSQKECKMLQRLESIYQAILRIKTVQIHYLIFDWLNAWPSNFVYTCNTNLRTNTCI